MYKIEKKLSFTQFILTKARQESYCLLHCSQQYK